MIYINTFYKSINSIFNIMKLFILLLDKINIKLKKLTRPKSLISIDLRIYIEFIISNAFK